LDSAAGFAESAEAAWLVERADLHLSAPLFRLVSIVDTPGLESISDHHDRTTENCIHKGQVFLVMVRLGHSTLSAATERTFHMIVQSLASQGIRRSEWGERVFVVLNWFRREVGARNPEQARSSADRFRDRLRATLGTEEPRVFLVELSPSRLVENPEKLLGYPSLALLKRQLRSFIGVRGIALRIRSLRNELERTFAKLNADLDIQESSIGDDSEDTLRRVERALARASCDGALHRQLHDRINEALSELTSPIATLHAELRREYDDEDDFRQARSVGVKCMTEYNRARNALKTELVQELEGAIASAARPWLQTTPKLSKRHLGLKGLPTMAAEAFGREVDRIVREWPSGWKRFWHAVGKFEYYVTTRSRELRTSYASDAAVTAVESGAAKFRSRIEASADAALAQVAAQLQVRLDDLRADASRQVERRREVETQRLRLADFHPALLRTISSLDTAVAHIEDLAHSGNSN